MRKLSLLTTILALGLMLYPNPAFGQETAQPPGYFAGGLNFTSGGHMNPAVQVGANINVATVRDSLGAVVGQTFSRLTLFASEYGLAPDSSNDIKAAQLIQFGKMYLPYNLTLGAGIGGRLAAENNDGASLVGVVEFGWKPTDRIEISINGAYTEREKAGDEFLLQAALSISWPRKT